MNPLEIFQPGMKREESFIVEEEHTAMHVGSGTSRVLATPWMIAYMERNSHRLLAKSLPEDYSSVGVQVNVRHLAPTPMGKSVRVHSQITEIDGLRITFTVQAWDEVEKIGDGTHQRYVIEEARFLKRVESKK
jgi:fluoroacetyl-CoA thioesterase